MPRSRIPSPSFRVAPSRPLRGSTCRSRAGTSRRSPAIATTPPQGAELSAESLGLQHCRRT
eukprot:3660372-Alexandrium_andersonii.AAC.1